MTPAPTLAEQLQAAFAADHTATTRTILEALEAQNVIRLAQASIAYDPLIIGAHRRARESVAEQIGSFIAVHDVVDFRKMGRDPLTGAAMLNGSVVVVLPERMQGKAAGEEHQA